MLKVLCVVGARPNFMKVAPIVEAMKRRGREFAPLLVHTGQHYGAQMSDIFFGDLGLPRPNVYLDVGSGTHAVQTALVMQRFEPVLTAEEPDWVVVVGDVNSTLACALVATKLHIRVAHVEAGLRSRDRRMPEEINRLLTDQIADLLLIPSLEAGENLRAEGIMAERICFVGNVMIDSLLAHLEQAKGSTVRESLQVSHRAYAVATLHRPSNTDDRAAFSRILSAFEQVSQRVPVIFPVHPRTRARISEFGLMEPIERGHNLRLTEPFGYLDFLHLYSGARLVLTDSGGLQEETTWLGIPCLTLRENTERPITVEMGTNMIVGTDTERITQAAFEILDAPPLSTPPCVPPLWDGRTADRILDAIVAATHPAPLAAPLLMKS